MDIRLDEMTPYSGFYSANGNYLITVAFNPWNGKIIKSGLKSYFIGILGNDFQNNERGNRKVIKEKVLQNIEQWKTLHYNSSVCQRLYDLVIGEDKGTTRATYLPMIRSYVVFSQHEKGEFEPMEYCPFCGAKLPERLDGVLTGILQKEYGLNSWKDYKKAPHEFHTDEWWKKRGL